MKKLTSLLLLIAALVIGVTGCDVQPRQHYQKKTNQTVSVYKQHPQGSTSDNDWLYWYVMFYNNHYYYFSSPSYVTPSSYSTANWQTADKSPITTATQETVNGQVVQEEAPVLVENQTVPNQELGTQMETTIDMTEQQISDMISEGNPNSQDYSSPSESSSSSDGGYNGGDSGSSGGDSGGGDSGGGGGGD